MSVSSLPNPRSGLDGGDGLLVIGVVASTIEGLSLGPLNLGELLVLGWCLQALARAGGRFRVPVPEVTLWILWLLVMVVGTLIGSQLLGSGTEPVQLLTWGYFALVYLSLVGRLTVVDPLYIRKLGDRMAIAVVVFHLALYAYAQFATSFLGVRLWYAGVRYTAGAANPHHIALLMLVASLMCLDMAARAETFRRRGCYAGCAIVALGLGVATASSTLYVALVGALGGMIVLRLARARSRTGFWLAMIGICLLAVLLRDAIADAVWRFIEADPNGMGRLEIWSSITDVWRTSPLVGLGPGTHGFEGVIEFHNAFVEVLAMSGLLGLVLFLVLVIRIPVLVSRDRILASGPSLAVIAYGAGGFSARRLIFWVVLGLGMALVLNAKRADLEVGGEQLAT